MRARFLLILLLGSVACSEETLTGAHVEFTATLGFTSGTGTQSQEIDPRIRDEVRSISVACGRIDLTRSSVASVDFSGGQEGDPFTLTASIVDGGQDTPLLTWTGKLERGGRLTSFDRAESGFHEAAAAKLGEILTRPDPKYTVRYDFSAGSAPASATVRVTQFLEFATDAAECPAL